MDKAHVRLFASSDEADLIRLWTRCELTTPANDPADAIARKVRHDRDGLLVAEVQNGLVGSVMIGYEGRRGWINYLAVDPSWRRRGLGRMLMETAESRLNAQGCPKINLQVRSSNQSVIAFYAELGYAVDDCISLGKRLGARAG
ncbi:MAG: GNAT family acetyltransferase [Planctomycetota bacterium]